jgi:hypothetical protein
VSWYAGGEHGWACHPKPNPESNTEFKEGGEEEEFWMAFNCPNKGDINDLASLLLGSREVGIKAILSVMNEKDSAIDIANDEVIVVAYSPYTILTVLLQTVIVVA